MDSLWISLNVCILSLFGTISEYHDIVSSLISNMQVSDYIVSDVICTIASLQ